MVKNSLIKLFESGKKYSFKKGELIFSPKSSANNIYFITKGYIIAYQKQKENKKIMIIYKKDEIFPVIWGLTNKRKSLYFEAYKNTEVFAISKNTFTHAITTDITVSNEVVKLLSQYLSIYVDRISNLELATAREKVISRLLFFKNRFGKQIGEQVSFDIPLTHQLIADSINVTRETVTREFSKLEEEKIISYKKRSLVINDIKILQNLAYSLFIGIAVPAIF